MVGLKNADQMGVEVATSGVLPTEFEDEDSLGIPWDEKEIDSGNRSGQNGQSTAEGLPDGQFAGSGPGKQFKFRHSPHRIS
jgi:hypothetical protein